VAHEGLDRREFLKVAGAATAGVAFSPYLPRVAHALPAEQPGGTLTGRAAVPFGLKQVSLGRSVFQQKRDRILSFAKNYPGTGGVLDGPDRLLYNFRANAGLPNPPGSTWPGGWDTPAHKLRGHFTGHFMTCLAQCYADTKDPIFTTKLSYLVDELEKVRATLAARMGKQPPEPEVVHPQGRFGPALQLNGSSDAQYVSMPAGILSTLSDFTIATWVNLSGTSSQSWARIFDFGTGTGTNMFMTANAGGSGVRFAIRVAGGTEQRVTAPPPLPRGWQHVAVTLSGNEATLYVNGASVASNGEITLRPRDLGVTENNWIGRSQYGDPLLEAAVDEFQIYDSALSPAQVAALVESPGGVSDGGNVAWYHFDENGGLDVADASGRENHATVTAAVDWFAPSHPGYLAAFPEGQYIRLEPPQFHGNYGGPDAVWAPWYTFHKIVRGLIDANRLAGVKQALPLAFTMGDWAYSRLSRISRADLNRMWDIYSAGETGGANEVMADLAALTDDPRKRSQYLETAKAFDFTPMLEANVRNEDILDGRHANTFVPPEVGHVRMYEQTGEEDYFTSARNFWHMIVPDRVWSQGGTSGPGEFFHRRGDMARYLKSASAGTTFAESCTAYNMLKLTRSLFFHDPNAAYFDYYEQGLYNQILGSKRDIDSDLGPWVTYHQNLFPGASRGPDWTRYVGKDGVGSCCTGSGLENHTKYQESIYAASADGSALYVNLYVASTLDWVEKGVTVVQETDFPYAGATRFVIARGNGTMDLKLRVPSWARKGFAVEVNGVPQRVDASPGSYCTVRRRWSTGDRVDVAMPFSYRIERTPDDPSVQSVLYGPLLMVGLGGAAPPIEWRQLSFYRHYTRDGDFSGAFSSTGTSLHVSSQDHTFAPFFVADPDDVVAYHAYFQRSEPEVRFGSVEAGVPNDAIRDEESFTFLDRVWEQAPFASHGLFMAHVDRVSQEWVAAGKHSRQQQQAILVAAAQAEEELRP
jgi:uncharacterized protein